MSENVEPPGKLVMAVSNSVLPLPPGALAVILAGLRLQLYEAGEPVKPGDQFVMAVGSEVNQLLRQPVMGRVQLIEHVSVPLLKRAGLPKLCRLLAVF